MFLEHQISILECFVKDLFSAFTVCFFLSNKCFFKNIFESFLTPNGSVYLYLNHFMLQVEDFLRGECAVIWPTPPFPSSVHRSPGVQGLSTS